MTGNHLPLVVLVGPTAVGKTTAAIELARRLDGEIISADSRLFYRGMDIGTAKPTKEEQAQVPHHLIDVADPDEVWSLAKFQEAAFHTIRSVHTRNHIPFLVGGTGQYVHAVIDGWLIPQVVPDLVLRKTLENWASEITPAGLHRRLAIVDPEAAAHIQYQNVRRTVRALEVILSTGKRFSLQRSRTTTPLETLLLGLTRPRKELYERIDQRIDSMVQAGLLDEVKSLLLAGYAPQLPTMTAIGYREMAAVLQNQISLEEAVRLMKQKTRAFVRRQANWFKLSDPAIHWYDVNPKTIRSMEDTIRHWLKKSKGEN